MPISVPFNSLTGKQEVHAANSAGSLPLLIPNIWFQNKRRKKGQNEIVIFSLTSRVRFCIVYPFFFHSPVSVMAASMSYGIRAWPLLARIAWPHLFAAAVLQAVSRHRTSYSCHQTLLLSENSSPSYSLTLSCAFVGTAGRVILYPVNSQK